MIMLELETSTMIAPLSGRPPHWNAGQALPLSISINGSGVGIVGPASAAYDEWPGRTSFQLASLTQTASAPAV